MTMNESRFVPLPASTLRAICGQHSPVHRTYDLDSLIRRQIEPLTVCLNYLFATDQEYLCSASFDGDPSEMDCSTERIQGDAPLRHALPRVIGELIARWEIRGHVQIRRKMHAASCSNFSDGIGFVTGRAIFEQMTCRTTPLTVYLFSFCWSRHIAADLLRGAVTSSGSDRIRSKRRLCSQSIEETPWA